MNGMMIGPPPETRWDRFKGLFTKIHPTVWAAIIAGVFGLLGLWLGSCLQSGKLQEKVDRLTEQSTDLKEKSAELHRELPYYKNLVAPLEQRAQQLYPELETAAALAKLADDVQTVRALANQDKYKPLSQKRRAQLESSLRSTFEAQAKAPKIIFGVEQGNSPRLHVGSDLKALLEDAGFTVEFRPQTSFRQGVPLDVTVSFHTSNTELVLQLANAIGTLFINRQFSGIKRDNLSESEIVIELNGDPLFTEEGVVTFR